MIMPVLTGIQDILCIVSGTVVGFTLGLIGGGGSILAVPLLVYLVGINDPHIAIGTTAFAVGMTALYSLFHHHRANNVRWAIASRFALVGVIGAFLGSEAGKAIDGKSLLVLFAVLMIVVAVRMFRGDRDVKAETGSVTYGKVYLYGGVVGVLAGFFGIGGGFLIVPAIMRSARLPIINAIGTSLVSVAALGLATALSYAWSGFVDWKIAAEYLCGGILGGWFGVLAANTLCQKKTLLRRVFSVIVFAVAGYVLLRQVG